METEMREWETGTLLAVTADLNGHISVAWVPPTTAPEDHIVMPDVVQCVVNEETRWISLRYGRKSGSTVRMEGSVIRILLDNKIRSILPPKYFIRSRTGGRVCVREDGIQIPVLTLIGKTFMIERPSWVSTNKCWEEGTDNVISENDKVIAGTREYYRKYQEKMKEERRTTREIKQRQSSEERIRAEMEVKRRAEEMKQEAMNDFDNLLKDLKKLGGGGPLSH